MQAQVDKEAKAQVTCDPRAIELVDAYGRGDALFSSPSCTVLGQNLDAVRAPFCAAEQPRKFAQLVTESLDRGGGSLVMGAIPFDPTLEPRLVIPRSLHRAGPLPSAPRRWVSNFDSGYVIHSIPAPEMYRAAVAQALELIESKQLTKVVVGRLLQLDWQQPLDVAALLRTLFACRRGFGFAIDLGPGASHAQQRRTLLGMSPELLVRRRGLSVTSQPLAGSIPRHEKPAEDRRVAQRLLASEKDRREHAVVVEAVLESLRAHCSAVECAPEPTLVQTETLWHLGTEVRGTLRDPATSSLELALALHPTPAVCGHPMQEARLAIAQLEPFERGFFTGAVGYSDRSGDGEWAVTIRAGQIEDNRLSLFAGAGIVAGSEPNLELAETSAKLNTLLRILGVPYNSEGGAPWS